MSARYSVSVRALCEFTARRGDLCVRFTPAPSAQQGIVGHHRVGARRGSGYEREIPLQACHQALRVRGRADGYDPRLNLLEEYKTHRGDLARMPPNQRGLHWAQVKMYGAMLCAERGLEAVDLGLVYYDIQSETETSFREPFSAEQLQREFEEHCGRFLAWALQELAHRDARDRSLVALRFPHGNMRTGQRQMAEAVYRAATAGQALMVQAPTGIGKTLGTLFPLLKAASRLKLDKVFFLVARTSGRELALRALGQLNAGAAPTLRVLELVAKDTACLHPGRLCQAESCPLAAGFYDRLPAARERALDAVPLDRDALRRVALAHQVCPYYLAQEMIRWCDVIVGDYNYFFDTSAILHALTQVHQWRVGLLVDEAHNLLARARDMYSAGLEPAVLEAALRAAPASLQPPLAGVNAGWRAIHLAQAGEYAVLPVIPPGFLGLLARATAALEDEMARGPATLDDALLRFYFHALHFSRRAAEFGSHSLFDVTRHAAGSNLCIRCINPGAFLNARFEAGVTAILFSATLAPAHFYRTLFGLPPGAAWIDVDSPFDRRQLEVRIESRISTRFHDRRRSISPIVDLMLRQYRARPGNYLAFFSSFDYLDAVSGLLRERSADVPVWAQTRNMPAGARDDFLAQFTLHSCGIGFAVLGGAFAEAIDLPGDRLIGAFIATLGLPQVNDVNTEVQRRMQALFGSGYEYTYLFPGLQKVIQAAGRVIRTPSDRGTVILIDDRYRGAQVRRLLPAWWRVQCG